MKDIGIKYSNSWEDPNLLLKSFDCSGGENILSIAASGDNLFSILTTNPSHVLAIDSNEYQLYLIELKMSAILAFDYSKYVAFIGLMPRPNRIKLYDEIKSKLSTKARLFWDNQREALENGIIHIGKFEQYLRIFGKRILPLIHNRKSSNTLLSDKSGEQQKTYYEQHWNTWKWRFLFKLFFSKTMMSTLGRNPNYLNHVGSNAGEEILLQTRNHLSISRCQQNPYLEYIVHGNFTKNLPLHLQEKHFETIKRNITSISLRLCLFNEIRQESSTFDRINCSDIFEYMSSDETQEHASLIADLLKSNGRVSYWNLLVDRDLTRNIPEQLRRLDIARIDDGFFYKSFHVNQKIC
jgi:S-adenosylmethionine-diacylglycerol 3-amino-3-carboxypropyl transferase